MTNLKAAYGTDKAKEANGVKVDFGGYSITVARAGGGNKRYEKMLDAKLKPFRRAIQTDSMDEELAKKIAMEVYAHTVVVGWEGVEGDDGQPLPFSPEACLKLFQELPDFFMEVQLVANKMTLYRQEQLEAAAKNS